MSDLPALEERLRALMLSSLDGDAASYRILMSELRDHLCRYFRRRLRDDLSGQVDDLVQETLLAIHTRRMTYDTRQPFTPWIYAIARYKLIDLLRRSKRRMHVPIADLADFLGSDTDAFDAARARHDIDKVLDTLPERVSSLIRRVKLEEQSVAEAAAASRMTEGAVKVAVHRGLKALAARFGGKS
jgi:RNA polymerase sigma-70 factor (ECF subfamily)